LNLQPPGIGLDDPRQLADSDDAAVRDIGDPGLPNDRGQMMLAMALERNPAQHNHLIVAFDLLERLLKDVDGVLRVAREILLERACDAARCLDQAVALRIVAGPADNRAHGRLDVGA